MTNIYLILDTLSGSSTAIWHWCATLPSPLREIVALFLAVASFSMAVKAAIWLGQKMLQIGRLLASVVRVGATNVHKRLSEIELAMGIACLAFERAKLMDQSALDRALAAKPTASQLDLNASDSKTPTTPKLSASETNSNDVLQPVANRNTIRRVSTTGNVIFVEKMTTININSEKGEAAA